jgi:hypothetical protein
MNLGLDRKTPTSFTPYFPLPWRVDEDWTAEIIAANGRLVTKLPYPYDLAEAHEIVRSVNMMFK